MCQKAAIKEWLKHFTANVIAGILHGLTGFSVALIVGAFIPVQLPVNTLSQLVTFAATVGAGAGILGSVLAVETEGDNFKATRVLNFVREAAYPESRRNGSQYSISTRYGLSISSKKAWQDYIFYI